METKSSGTFFFAWKLRLRLTVWSEGSFLCANLMLWCPTGEKGADKKKKNSNCLDLLCTTHPYCSSHVQKKVWAHIFSGVYWYNMRAWACVCVCVRAFACVSVCVFCFFFCCWIKQLTPPLPITVNLTLSSHLCEYSTRLIR